MKQRLASLLQRYNTSALWTSVNPILLKGELGIESDTHQMKIGDGVTAWNNLEYFIFHISGVEYTVGNGLVLTNNTLSLALQYEIIGE